MSDQIRYPKARRQATAQLRALWLSGGSLKLYTEPTPAANSIPSADVALSGQTLLAIYALPDPLGDVIDGIITAATIAAAINLDNGTPKFGRAVDSSGAIVGDFDVGVVGSGEAIEVDNLNFTAGSLSTITSFVIVEG